jgi:hypothetical protein
MVLGTVAIAPVMAFGVDRISYYDGMMQIIKKLDSIDNKLFMLVAMENREARK